MENRISFANAGGVQYFYDAQNKRVWQATCIPGYCTPGGTWYLNTATVNLFGADGKQLASYGPIPAWNNMTTNQVAITFGPVAVRSYFGGRLVGQQLGTNIYKPVIQDRLGSVGKYYPYGEERNAPQLANDQVKFATYTRDSATGNDYADQRYYTSTLGRFMTADHFRASAGPGDPGSWNRYSYTRGDPVNRMDPSGEDDCGADFCVTVTSPASNSEAPPLSSPTDILFGVPDIDFDQNAASQVSDVIGTALAQVAIAVEQLEFKQVQSAFQNAASLIAGTTSWSSNCEQDFAALGVSDSAVEAAASTAQFLDGVGSSATMASLYAGAAYPIVGQLGAQLPGTVGQDIAAHPTGVVADAQLGGNLIYLNGPLISGLLTGYYHMTSGGTFDVTAITMHELLHNLTGLTDPDIQTKLGLSQGGVSDKISQKLSTDCFPK